MSTQIYSIPSQTEGRRKAFLEWKSVNFDLNYLLHVGVITLTIIKAFIVLFLLVRIGNIQAIFKTNQ